MQHGKPLDGVVVVELGHSVAGPYAGLILADLGARVIKVENPETGDYARGWGPPFWGDTSSSFASLNRGKEGLAVNLADPEQAAALRRLIVEQADAVIQNLRAGILDKFGLNPDELRRDKRELIWCDIGAFGARGPLAAKPGYDPLVQASTGIMSVTGEGGDRPPVRVGVSIIDMGSGMWAVIGLLSALLVRARSGQGMRVSTSLYETGLAWMMIPLAGYEAEGDIRQPYGSGVAEIVPYQHFDTSDGRLMIAAGNDNLFRKLCGVLGLDSLATDPDYQTNEARVRNRTKLISIVAEAVGRRRYEELSAQLDAQGVPNAPLLTVDQVARHAQTEALEMSVEAGGLRLMGVPLSFDGERTRAPAPAPGLGEHNHLIEQPEERRAREV